ncbi:hypothetical protein HDU96_001843 [Phlyctochytrium bullatum]|nr:hypothetical protein HDU96_001843 [Phlyctochytrium bullatum]
MGAQPQPRIPIQHPLGAATAAIHAQLGQIAQLPPLQQSPKTTAIAFVSQLASSSTSSAATPSPISTPASSGSGFSFTSIVDFVKSLSLTVKLLAGGGVLLVLAIIVGAVIACVVRRRRRRQKQREDEEEERATPRAGAYMDDGTGERKLKTPSPPYGNGRGGSPNFGVDGTTKEPQASVTRGARRSPTKGILKRTDTAASVVDENDDGRNVFRSRNSPSRGGTPVSADNITSDLPPPSTPTPLRTPPPNYSPGLDGPVPRLFPGSGPVPVASTPELSSRPPYQAGRRTTTTPFNPPPPALSSSTAPSLPAPSRLTSRSSPSTTPSLLRIPPKNPAPPPLPTIFVDPGTGSRRGVRRVYPEESLSSASDPSESDPSRISLVAVSHTIPRNAATYDTETDGLFEIHRANPAATAETRSAAVARMLDGARFEPVPDDDDEDEEEEVVVIESGSSSEAPSTALSDTVSRTLVLLDEISARNQRLGGGAGDGVAEEMAKTAALWESPGPGMAEIDVAAGPASSAKAAAGELMRKQSRSTDRLSSPRVALPPQTLPLPLRPDAEGMRTAGDGGTKPKPPRAEPDGVAVLKMDRLIQQLRKDAQTSAASAAAVVVPPVPADEPRKFPIRTVSARRVPAFVPGENSAQGYVNGAIPTPGSVVQDLGSQFAVQEAYQYAARNSLAMGSVRLQRGPPTAGDGYSSLEERSSFEEVGRPGIRAEPFGSPSAAAYAYAPVPEGPKGAVSREQVLPSGRRISARKTSLARLIPVSPPPVVVRPQPHRTPEPPVLPFAPPRLLAQAPFAHLLPLSPGPLPRAMRDKIQRQWRPSWFLQPPPPPTTGPEPRPVPKGESPELPEMALVVLNQPLCDLSWFERIWAHAKIKLCADGGANRLYDKCKNDETRKRFLPDRIIGDLDSIRTDVKNWYIQQGVTVEKIEDQDSTDLGKCVKHIETLEAGQAARDPTHAKAQPTAADTAAVSTSAQTQDPDVPLEPSSRRTSTSTLGTAPPPSVTLAEAVENPPEGVPRPGSPSRYARYELVVLGALGGRFDQTMASVNALFAIGSARKSYLVCNHSVVILLTPNFEHRIECDRSIEGPTCGLIPVGCHVAHMVTEGFKWNLDKTMPSAFGGLVSTSNAFEIGGREGKAILKVNTDQPVLFSVELDLDG